MGDAEYATRTHTDPGARLPFPRSAWQVGLGDRLIIGSHLRTDQPPTAPGVRRDWSSPRSSGNNSGIRGGSSVGRLIKARVATGVCTQCLAGPRCDAGQARRHAGDDLRPVSAGPDGDPGATRAKRKGK